ncbi:MAG: hypothetical protein JWQ29_991, partial [Phenylobacterium sp.]|nr:hypothetical protein [Phenylobacterium sp.]
NPAPPWPNGTRLAEGGDVALDGREGPGFVLDADVTLTTAQIAALAVEPPGDPASLLPAQPPPGGVEPFGPHAAQGARFHILLDGDLLAANAAGRPSLSLGVETDCPVVADSRARLSATVLVAAGEFDAPVVKDGTAALAQSGVLLLDLSALVGRPGDGHAVLILTLEAARRPLPARVTRLALNVLPIRQETRVQIEAKGNGLPDQTIALPDGVRFGAGFDPPTVVRLTGAAQDEAWVAREDLAGAGPGDRVFTFDPAARLIRFGNGVNGRAPALAADMRVTCRACAGAQGLIPAGTAWTVDGVLGRFWNPQPTEGGLDSDGLPELRRESRERARAFRPLVTDADLAAAALGAQDLRVRRAEVLGGYEPDNCARLAGAARTLVAMGATAGQDGSEPPAWLDLLRRRIRPQLVLGDRVRIVRPAYVPVRLRAVLTPRSGTSPAQLQAAVDTAVAERLRLVPAREGDAVWPLGLDLHAYDLAGWLRRVPGVAAVGDVAVGEAGAQLGRAVHLPRHGLPVLVREAGDIGVGAAP